MTLVLDTGYFLLLAAKVARSNRQLIALSKAAKRLRYDLAMSSLVWAECASHTCYAEPALPYTAWEHADPMVFLREFRTIVTVHPASVDGLVEAAKMLRRVIDPRADPHQRRGPTLADAATASLVQELDAELLVTDDVEDFERLLPRFDGEIVAPRLLVDQLSRQSKR